MVIISNNPQSKLIYESDSEDDVCPDEIWQKYTNQKEESECFDIYDVPGIHHIGTFFPSFEGGLREVVGAATAAINSFNEEHQTHYKFEMLQRTTTVLCSGLDHFITFLAKQDGDSLKTFQAEVWVTIKGENQVQLCRLKPL